MFSDIRYALRTLRNSPVFAFVAVLSLALGIGANTAIFTFVDQLLLRLLPVKDPQQLVLLTWKGSHYGSNRGPNMLSYPIYKDFRERNQVFSDMFCRRPIPVSISANGQTERASGELVTGNYFQVLGVGAALGRTFTPDDDRIPGGHPLAVLSHAYWKSRFAGDPHIVGKTILVNEHNLTIIGVSQEGFDGVEPGTAPQIRIPIMMKAEMTPGWNDLDDRRSRWVNVFGRLKPGVTLEQAKASLQPIFHAILNMEVREKAFAHADDKTKQDFLRSSMDVLPGSQGRSGLRNQFKKPLWVLMAIVGLVLLIACANIANLLLARATSRQKEMAVRLAIGASRARIVRQLLIESLLLAGIGGLLGLALAAGGAKLLLGLIPNQGSGSVSLSSAPDLRILLFNIAVSLVTGILFGLIPAFQSTRPDVSNTLKEQAGAVVGGSHVMLRKLLVVAQVSLSLLLLIGAGLFIRTLWSLRTLDPGFKTTNLISFNVDPGLNGYEGQRVRSFYKRLTETMNNIPGVDSAALSSIQLLDGDDWESSTTVDSLVPRKVADPSYNAVSPGFFKTMNLPLLAGRDFNLRDENPPHAKFEEKDFEGWRVCLINQKMAKEFFGNASPIGRRIGQGGDPGTKLNIEIIGVVGDSRYNGLREEVPMQVYVPYMAADYPFTMTVYARTTAPSEQMFNAIRARVREIDPNMPVFAMRTLDDQLDRTLVTERLIAGLSAAFGVLATLLAVIGLYGVMAYTVARRSREIGIRMALGAIGGNVLWLIMREVVALVGVGVAIGLPSAWALTQIVKAQLYGIEPHDMLTIVGATAALALVALAAGYIPAWRATRLDPIKVLRYE